jgi:hypothetical protein
VQGSHSHGLVGEEGDVFADGLGVDEALGFLSLASPKRRLPAPSTTGWIISRSSSEDGSLRVLQHGHTAYVKYVERVIDNRAAKRQRC